MPFLDMALHELINQLHRALVIDVPLHLSSISFLEHSGCKQIHTGIKHFLIVSLHVVVHLLNLNLYLFGGRRPSIDLHSILLDAVESAVICARLFRPVPLVRRACLR